MPRHSFNRWLRGFFTRAALILAGCAAAVLVIEVALRILALPTSRNPLPDLYVAAANPLMGYRMIPNFHGYAYGSWVTTNARGFRCDDAPEGEGSGGKRILIIGDSITFGFGLESRETMASRLREDLASDPGPRPRVHNLGVCGYNLEQEFEVFKEEGLAPKPDLVILVVMANDTDPTSTSPGSGSASSGLRRALRHARSVGRARSRLWSVVEYSWRRWRIGRSAPSTAGSDRDALRRLLKAVEVWQEPVWARFIATLARFQALARERNIPLLVAFWGAPGAFDAELSKECTSAGIMYMALQMAYENGSDDPAYTLTWDSHPSALAAARMAATLAAFVRVEFPALSTASPQQTRQAGALLVRQRRSWRHRRQDALREQESALSQIPDLIDFTASGGYRPPGALSGVDSSGRVSTRYAARLVVHGQGEALDVAGHFQGPPGSLRITCSPEWDETAYKLDGTTFRLNVDLPGKPHDPRFVKIEIRGPDGLTLTHVGIARRMVDLSVRPLPPPTRSEQVRAAMPAGVD
jgi:lysophospholipase L1-like esterase